MNSNHFFSHLRTRLLGPPAPRLGTRLQTGVKLLCIFEGPHDLAFFRGISRILHADDPMLPDLGELERSGTIVILPVGGGDVLAGPPGWRHSGCRSSIFSIARCRRRRSGANRPSRSSTSVQGLLDQKTGDRELPPSVGCAGGQ